MIINLLGNGATSGSTIVPITYTTSVINVAALPATIDTAGPPIIGQLYDIYGGWATTELYGVPYAESPQIDCGVFADDYGVLFFGIGGNYTGGDIHVTFSI